MVLDKVAEIVKENRRRHLEGITEQRQENLIDSLLEQLQVILNTELVKQDDRLRMQFQMCLKEHVRCNSLEQQVNGFHSHGSSNDVRMHALSPDLKAASSKREELPRLPTHIDLKSSHSKSAVPELQTENVVKQESKILSDETKHDQLKQVVAHLRTLLGWTKNNRRSDEELADDMRVDPIQQVFITLTNHVVFQVVTALLIISNTLLIAVEADISVRNCLKYGSPRTEWMTYLDYVYTPLFTIELLLQLMAERWFFFSSSERVWNIFDMVLVMTAISEMAFQTFNLSFMRVLRVLRMLRVLRVVRVFKVFRELRLMVVSIVSSLLTLTWAFILLLIVQFCFAICFEQAVATYLARTEDVTADVYKGIEKHFSHLTHGMYTLMASISGGWEWTDIADLLYRISPMQFGIYIFYVMFVLFGILNVLVGVFVDSASQIAKVDHQLVLQAEMDRNSSFMNQLEQLFRELDTDHSGTVSWNELQDHLEDPRVKAYFSELQMEIHEADGLFKLLDTDDSGEVPIEEWMLACMKLKGTAKSIDIATMMYDEKRSQQKREKEFKYMVTLLHQILAGLPQHSI